MNEPVTWEESQSLDYITIAKAGGRKDLLCHRHYVPEECTERSPRVPTVDWFAHPTPPPLNHDPSYQSTLSRSWMQWSSLETELPPLQIKGKPKHSRTRSDPVRLPKITQTDGVDFTRLMSLDYQREWLDERESKEHKLVRKAKMKKAAQKRKIHEHTLKARKIAGVDQTCENKERFVMKRFSNVPSRVKLPPL